MSKIMNIRLLDYVHRNTEIVTCIPSDYGITYIVIQNLKLLFPGITELQDYTHFGRIQSQILNRGLRNYIHRNPEIVTCIPSDYGITYIVIQKLKLVFPGITELQDYTHFGRLQSQIWTEDYGITYIVIQKS